MATGRLHPYRPLQALIDKDWSKEPPIPESEMSDLSLGANRAMKRTTEKELDRKRKPRYDIVLWKDDRVQVVDS